MTNAAVQYALAQVGKPYVFGAAGPKAFDCSGLTVRACEQIGVELPHNAEQQAIALRYAPATLSNKLKLQPGDLVFYYSPITHVALYVGREGHERFVVAAVDEAHGVMRHHLFEFAKPSGYGYVNHG